MGMLLSYHKGYSDSSGKPAGKRLSRAEKARLKAEKVEADRLEAERLAAEAAEAERLAAEASAAAESPVDPETDNGDNKPAEDAPVSE